MSYPNRRRWKEGVRVARRDVVLSGLLLLSLLLGACGTAMPEASIQGSPTAGALAPPTASAPAAPTETEAPTPTPSATVAPPPAPSPLLILNTNDNWGETEPCG